MTSPTGVMSGSSPRSTTRRTTSRSEKTPTRRSPSSTRTMPTLLALMTCTAALTVSSRCTTKRNPARMISRSFFIASPPVGTGRYRAAAGPSRRGAWERAPVGRTLECAQGALQHHHRAAGAADRAGPVGVVVREATVVEPRHQLVAALADQQEPAAARAGLRRAAGDRDVVGGADVDHPHGPA